MTNKARHTITADDYRYAYGVALRYVRDADAAQDVAQDALVTAFRSLDRFRGDCKWKTWLYRVAQTAALMHLRKRKRRSNEFPASDTLMLTHAPAPTDLSDRIEQREMLIEIENKVHALPKNQQDAFWMRYGLGYTDRETADLLKVPKATVKTRAHRARSAVRDIAKA